jgi:uncharacterized protein (TIGR00730 family)
MRISVFGGSTPKPGEPAYNHAYQLGKMIGEAGHTVLTGGYHGTMEAVSRGASESGGWVVGVTCDQIEKWRPIPPNDWIHEEQRHATQKERLYALIENCDSALVLPGGIGTFAEFAVMWSQMQIGAISPRKLIFVGDGWRELIEFFFDHFDEYIPEMYRSLLLFAPEVSEAFQILVSNSDQNTVKKTGN